MSEDLAARVPELLRAVAAEAAGEVCLVGGAVRDLLLGRPTRDWDLAARDAERLAERVAAAAGSHAVVLRAEPATFRVPLDLGHADVVELGEPDVAADLLRRDFTVNALALDVRTGELADPAGGLRDLEARTVRAVSDSAFADDPARLVRAYRLSAELGFDIEPRTRAMLARDRELLGRAAPQRWGRELLLLLAAEGPAAPAVGEMDEDRVLDEVLPEWRDLRGVEQGPYHHLDVRGHTLEAVTAADRLLVGEEPLYTRSRAALAEVREARSGRAMVRAAALLHDIGKPPKRDVDEAGRIWFRGHDALGAEMAGMAMRRWAWPRPMRLAVVAVIRLHIRVMDLAREAATGSHPASDAALRRLSRDAGDGLPALCLMGACDLLSSQGPATDPATQAAMIAELDRMLARALELREERRQRPRLVTGRDLMSDLGLRQGPGVGRSLAAIEHAREEGAVTTREEALDLARRLSRAGVASEGAPAEETRRGPTEPPGED